MSTRQLLRDSITKHGVFLNRYAGHRAAVAEELMQKLKGKVLLKMNEASVGDYIKSNKIYRNRSDASLDRDIGMLNKVLFGTFEKYTESELKVLIRFAQSEGMFAAKLLTASSTAIFAAPAKNQLSASVASKKMSTGLIKGLSIPDALSEFGKRKTKQILNVVSDGILEGKTTQGIAKVLNELFDFRIKNQANSLARTLTNAASSNAMESMMLENKGLLEGYEFNATLDGKTTLICASNDGKRFNVGAGPRPPLHFRCRSRMVPIVKPEYDLGAKVTGGRSSKGSSGPKQVGGNVTYGGWLKRQSHEFQDIAIGEERAKLFRGGKLKIENFVDPTGRTYTLNELQAIYPKAF